MAQVIKMNISVYGSAKPRPSEPKYEQAYRLGRLLGSAGHTVITGGYMGSMAATSHGAAHAGAHVIGVTCEEIEAWRPGKANQWVKEEWRTVTLLQRIEMMLRNSQAAIALPGGIGTLTEIIVTWNHLAVAALTDYPFVLVGEGWRQLLTAFIGQGEVSQHDQRFLHFVSCVEEAAELFANQPN